MDRKESYKMPDLLEVGSIVNVIKINSVKIGEYKYKGIEIIPSGRGDRRVELVLDPVNEGEGEKIPLSQIAFIDVVSKPIED